MGRLELTPKAAKALGRLTPEEQADVKASREVKAAEALAQQQVERVARESARQSLREELKAPKQRAEQADRALAAAIERYDMTVKALDPSVKIRAERAFQDGDDDYKKASAAYDQARDDLIEAAKTRQDRIDALEALNTKHAALTTQVEAEVRIAHLEAQEAWGKAPKAFAKGRRDRALKNQAREILKIDPGSP